MKVGRNDPCPCGSGKKYKHCCYSKDSVKHDTAEPEVETPDAEAETDSEEHHVAPDETHHHGKDRSRFEGQNRGRGTKFRPNASRNARRGS